MVWAMRTVFLMIPSSAWSPGGRIDPPPPFDAFDPGEFSLKTPFAIVHAARRKSARRLAR
jgi:hypothetical protein